MLAVCLHLAVEKLCSYVYTCMHKYCQETKKKNQVTIDSIMEN